MRRVRHLVAESVELADQASRDVTTLGEGLPSATARVVGRGEWIRGNLEGLRFLTDPHAERLLARSNLPPAVSGRIVGAQLGLVFGYLATRVLGQYEVFLPEDEGRLTVVGPNLLQAGRELADADTGGDAVGERELILGVVLHELGHRLQFEGVPWLRGHMHALITDYMAGTDLDPQRVRNGLGDLVQKARRGGLGLQDVLEAFLTPEQAAGLARAQAVMSVLEGHGNIVMDWGLEELGDRGVDPSRVRTALNRRRGSQTGVSRTVGKALGMELKAAQYSTGETFIAEVADRHGRQAFHRVWEDPANLPTPDELEDPDAWVARTSTPS